MYADWQWNLFWSVRLAAIQILHVIQKFIGQRAYTSFCVNFNENPRTERAAVVFEHRPNIMFLVSN